LNKASLLLFSETNVVTISSFAVSISYSSIFLAFWIGIASVEISGRSA